jgi:hypothetical protein
VLDVLCEVVCYILSHGFVCRRRERLHRFVTVRRRCGRRGGLMLFILEKIVVPSLYFQKLPVNKRRLLPLLLL